MLRHRLITVSLVLGVASKTDAHRPPHVALAAPPIAEHVAPLQALAMELIDRGVRCHIRNRS